VENPEKGIAAEQIMQFCRKNRNYQLKFLENRQERYKGYTIKKEVFIITNPKMDIPASPAFWTNNESIIMITQDYFDSLWSNASENPYQQDEDAAV
jgi:hypothetical protein